MLASSSVEFGELDRTRNQGFHMDLEIRRFDSAEHFVDRLPKCRYFSYGGDGDKLASGDDGGGEDEVFDSVVSDDKAELVAHAKGFLGAAGEDLERSTAAKLLRLCCNLDTALAHSARRVDVLLKRQTRTVLRTRDELRQLALDLSLSSTRMDVIWNPNDHTVEDLVVVFGEEVIFSALLVSEKERNDDGTVVGVLAIGLLCLGYMMYLELGLQSACPGFLLWPFGVVGLDVFVPLCLFVPLFD